MKEKETEGRALVAFFFQFTCLYVVDEKKQYLFTYLANNRKERKKHCSGI